MKKFQVTQFIVGLVLFLMMSMIHALTPQWTFTPDKAYPPNITVSQTGTALVKYTVTNQTKKARTLVMNPLVGINQEAPCMVAPKGSAGSSCTLTLSVIGGLLPSSGISGGPNLCQANANGTANTNVCYQPSPTNTLHIKVTPVPGLVAINISPVNPAIPLGTNQQFTATGVYSDKSTKDLTNSVGWSSSNVAVATISSSGLATANTTASGQVTIKATSGSVSSTTTLTVTNASLQSIVIKPDTPTIANGTLQKFIAIGTFSDGTALNITSSVTWTSSVPTVAQIGRNGLAVGVGVGTTTIKATLGSISSQTTLTVTDAVLTNIKVIPIGQAIPQGLTVQYKAIGFFSDNTQQNLTDSVVWLSSNSSVATVSTEATEKGLVTSITSGNTLIIAVSDNVSGATKLTVTSATLSSITVTPVSATINQGITQQYTAIGAYTNGQTYNITSSVDWESSDPTIVAISNEVGSNGLATGYNIGNATITATLNATVSNKATVNVTEKTLKSISVTPSYPIIIKGFTQQFTATGIYSDSSQQDLTNAVSWASDTMTVADFSTGTPGEAIAINAGSTTISATYTGVSGSTKLTVTAPTLQSISVTPVSATINQGTTQQYTAMGAYSNGQTYNITSSVDWNSSNPTAASISNDAGSNGLATGFDVGSTNITASLAGVFSTSVPLSVVNKVYSSIIISPPYTTIVQGSTQQFTATGVYQDGSSESITNDVSWSSSNPAYATIDDNGVATASNSNSGTTQIKATYIATGIEGIADLTVSNATLVSITVTPGNGTKIAKGTSEQYTAMGAYSNGQIYNITSSVDWNSSNPAAASISNDAGSNGLATGNAEGMTNITASLMVSNGQLVTSSAVTLEVTTATITSIEISPTNPSIPAGTTQQFYATGNLSDGTTQDLTSSASWTSDNATIADFSSSSAPGLATGLASGNTGINATYATADTVKVGSTGLTVSTAALSTITVAPVNTTVALGTAVQYTAYGHYTNGQTYNITSAVVWSASPSNIVSFSNVLGSEGLATTTHTGTTTITASLSTKQSSTSLTVKGSYSLGGSVSGLVTGEGYSLTLENNGLDNLVISDNGSYTFPEQYLWGSSYNVIVSSQPTQQHCAVYNGSGVIDDTVTNIDIVCDKTIHKDSFRTASTTLPWTSFLNACLTASGVNNGDIPTCPANTEGGFNGNTPDSDGEGALRLTTTNPSDQTGGIIIQETSPTEEGLSLDFTVYAYSSTGTVYPPGADGVSFMILNGDGPQPDSLGCFGSGLGYGTIPYGYVGIGFDEWGNFSKTPVCTQGTPLDSDKNKIVIRGATTQDSATSNPYILGNVIPTPPGPMWVTAPQRSDVPGLNYHITFTRAGVVSVFANGIPYLTGVNVVPIAGTPPSNLYFGFAAGTGSHVNIHEIQDFSISIPSSVSLDVSILGNSDNQFTVGINEYTVTIRNTGGATSSGSIQLLALDLPTGISINGALSLSGPASSEANLSGCNDSGSSLGSSCIINRAQISNNEGSNYLTVTIPVSVTNQATNGNYSVSINGGSDLGCVSTTYSDYLCSGSAAVTIQQ